MIKPWVVFLIYTIMCLSIGAVTMKKVMLRTIINNGCGQYNFRTGDFEYIKK